LAIRSCPAFPQYVDGYYIIVTLKYANDEELQNAVSQWAAKERKYLLTGRSTPSSSKWKKNVEKDGDYSEKSSRCKQYCSENL